MFYVFTENIRKKNYFLCVFYIISILFIVVPFILVLVSAFSPYNNNGIHENFAFINYDVFNSIFRSLFVSLITIIFVFFFCYSFAYFVVNIKKKSTKISLIAFVASPLWSSFFVKLLGLKSFFDLVYGDVNSTRGLLYVIVGLIYINLPLAILNFYNILNHMPKNLVNASLDLGHSGIESIFRVVLPYTKESIMSVIFLVFLPSFTTMTVADFLNHDNSSKLIGQIINNYAVYGVSDSLPKSRISLLSLFLLFLVSVSYVFIKLLPFFCSKFVFFIRNKYRYKYD